MSSSDPVPGRLVVRSPGATLDVLDPWLEPVPGGGAIGELNLEVAPGTYQVSARIADTEKTELVVVRPGCSTEIDISVEFSAAAPVDRTTTANETHGDLARDLTGPASGRPAAVAPWRSCSLVLILRGLRDRVMAPLPTTDAPFELFDQRERPVHLPALTSVGVGPEPIPRAVGWAMPLRPGGYRLRWGGPSEQPIEHAIWLSPGWQTLLFIPQGARGPYLPEMSIHLLRTGSSWDRHSQSWLAVEAALAALRGTAVGGIDPRSADFVTDADNPMLALLTLHILGRANRAGMLGIALDQDLAKRVTSGIRQLRRSLGWHPDVAALEELWSTRSGGRRPRVSSTPWPPMLATSLDLLLAAEARHPKVIPAPKVIPTRSLTEAVSAQRYATSPWLLWNPEGLRIESTTRRPLRSRSQDGRAPSRGDGVHEGTRTRKLQRIREGIGRWVEQWAKWWKAHQPWDRPLRVYRTAGRRAAPSRTPPPVAVERVEDLVRGVAHVLQVPPAEAAQRLGTRVIAQRLGMAGVLAKRCIEPALLRTGDDVTQMQIPAKAVKPDGTDIVSPLKELLQGVNLLGDDQETQAAGRASAAITGPPQSVAVIEAGATAASKWWATGLGATVIAAWTAASTWWRGQNPENQRVALWAAAIITAAAVLGIAYLLGSDVRGRGAGAVATIQARAKLADTLVRASQAVFVPTPPVPSEQLIALPAPLAVAYTAKPSAEESGWYAVALMSNGTETKYLIAKDSDHEWVDKAQVRLMPAAQ